MQPFKINLSLKLIFIKYVVTLFSAAPFLNEFSKKCYGSSGDCQSEVKLFNILLKLDTNDFSMVFWQGLQSCFVSRYY